MKWSLRRHAYRLGDTAAAQLWEELDKAHTRRDIAKAADQKTKDVRRNLKSIAGLAQKLSERLRDKETEERLSAYRVDELINEAISDENYCSAPTFDLAAVIERLAQAAGASASQIETSDQLDVQAQPATVRDGLAPAFEAATGRSATVSTNEYADDGGPEGGRAEPSGAFVDFVQAVYAAWGESITPGAVKGALYRPRKPSIVT